jgi:hypothetical protein
MSAQQQLSGVESNLAGEGANWAQNQAGFTQQAQLASMGAINSANQNQAQLNTQNAQFNSGQQNQQNLNQAQLLQQAGLSHVCRMITAGVNKTSQ